MMLKQILTITLTCLGLIVANLIISCGAISQLDSFKQFEDIEIEGDFKSAIIAINTLTLNSSERENVGLPPAESAQSISYLKTNSHTMPLIFVEPIFKKSTQISSQKKPTNQTNTLSFLNEEPETIEFYDPFQEKKIHATKTTSNNSCIIYIETSSQAELLESNSFNYNLASAMNYIDTSIINNATELLGPSLGTPLDIDNNNKIIIFITTIKNNQGIEQENIHGFHWNDNLSDSHEHSNKRELLYINKNNIINKTYKHVIAHEYVHLLVASYRIKQSKNSNFETWLEEGIAEGLSPYLSNQKNITREAFRSLNYQEIVNGNGPFYTSEDIRVEPYILGYTFLDYCRIQMNQEAEFYKHLIETMIESNTTNYKSLDSIIKTFNPSGNPDVIKNFQDAFTSYKIANHVKHPSNKYGYKNHSYANYIPNMQSPTHNLLSLEAGGSIYFIEGDYTKSAINDFTPEESGKNIKFIRIKPTN